MRYSTQQVITLLTFSFLALVMFVIIIVTAIFVNSRRSSVKLYTVMGVETLQYLMGMGTKVATYLFESIKNEIKCFNGQLAASIGKIKDTGTGTVQRYDSKCPEGYRDDGFLTCWRPPSKCGDFGHIIGKLDGNRGCESQNRIRFGGFCYEQCDRGFQEENSGGPAWRRLKVLSQYCIATGNTESPEQKAERIKNSGVMRICDIIENEKTTSFNDVLVQIQISTNPSYLPPT